MPFVWALLAALGLALLSAVLLVFAMLFTPLVFAVDSETGQMRVGWLLALEYRRPLPWTRGEPEMRFAGKALKFSSRKAKRKRKPAVRGARSAQKRARTVRFLRRCLRQPDIRRICAKRIAQLARRMLRSARWTRRRIELSLPDPAWNGMLAGWLAWRGSSRHGGHAAERMGGPSPAVRVNFTGENKVLVEVRVYPYRIVTALLVFSTGLPYRALLREWRAASAFVS